MTTILVVAPTFKRFREYSAKHARPNIGFMFVESEASLLGIAAGTEIVTLPPLPQAWDKISPMTKRGADGKLRVA